MLQRIQSLFLFIALVAAVVVHFFPLASYLGEIYYLKFYIYGLRDMAPDPSIPVNNLLVAPLYILNGIAAVLILITLISYKKRIRQLKILRIAILLSIVNLILIFFFYSPKIESVTGARADFLSEAGIYFPLIMLLFLILANRYIRKDERIVRSIDRIR